MANEEFGPLAPLIGTWRGDQGVNVSMFITNIETTALGAASLAALGAGLVDDLAQLGARWRPDPRSCCSTSRSRRSIR